MEYYLKWYLEIDSDYNNVEVEIEVVDLVYNIVEDEIEDVDSDYNNVEVEVGIVEVEVELVYTYLDVVQSLDNVFILILQFDFEIEVDLI